MPSSGGSQTTVQKADPWKGIQPGLEQAAKDSTNLYNAGGLEMEYFPGSTVVGFSPETQAAMGLTANRALQGNPATNAAGGLLTDTINGQYLNSNPYLDATFNKAANAVEGRVNSSFAGAGRFGGGLNQRVLGDSLGDLATDIYGGNYMNERENQMKSAALSPTLAANDYIDINALMGVGAQKENLEKAKLQESIDRFNFNQSAPAQNIQNYVDLLNGVGGNYKTGTASSSSGSGGLLGGVGNVANTVGGLGQAGLSAYALYGLLSDARAKKDIKLVGEQNGFNLYEFTYKHDGSRHIGVMAQEVIKTRPDAISIRDDGMMLVNYDAIGVTPLAA